MSGSSTMDLRNRDALWQQLQGETFDVAVIGAGITGAGIARDAALRGLRTALIDARDFAAGTSSRSTKLVHGGLRYLAQGDVALVREAAQERSTVQRLAPHLALTTQVVLPVRSRAAAAKFRAGIWTYEKLGSVTADERHSYWNAAELKRQEPLLKTEQIHGAIVYAEYLTDDARLTLANVRDAAAHGAVVVNYVSALGLELQDGRAAGVQIGDALQAFAGQASTAQPPTAHAMRGVLRAKVVVNAAGPWVDQVLAMEGGSVGAAKNKHLQLTKGIHLVASRSRINLSHIVYGDMPDGRSVFFVPRGEHVYIGTTDTFYQDPEYWPQVGAEDVDYLLDAVDRYVNVSIDAHLVQRTWCGIRPLVAQTGKSPSEISRKDELSVGPAGVVTIAGGKLTAYRRMAERVVDAVEKQLNRASPVPCSSGERPLPGGAGSASLDQLRTSIVTLGHSEAAAERLVRLYGDEARTIAASTDTLPAEVQQAVLHEGAVTLEDWWVRRSSLLWFGGSTQQLHRAAEIMAPLLQWSPAETNVQIQHCERLLADAATVPSMRPSLAKE